MKGRIGKEFTNRGNNKRLEPGGRFALEEVQMRD